MSDPMAPLNDLDDLRRWAESVEVCEVALHDIASLVLRLFDEWDAACDECEAEKNDA